MGLATWGRPGVSLTQPGNSLNGTQVAADYLTKAPADLPLTQPYWLKEPGTAGLFRVDDPTLIGRAENPPALAVDYLFEVGGQTLVVADELTHVTKTANGERLDPVDVIAPVSLRFVPEVQLFAPNGSRPVVVEISAARAEAAGRVTLDLPAGWKAAPASQPFHFTKDGETARFAFDVTASAQTGTANLGVHAEVNGANWKTQRYVIDYAHIPRQLLQSTERLRAVTLDLKVGARRVGYLPGSGDAVADCLAQMGCTVTMLTGADLTPEKLSDLDAVVIGVRAFNVRTDLADHLAGLLAYVEAGGTVIAQYNWPRGLKTPNLGPYPLTIGNDLPRYRVTDENAPVTFLAPEHPALTTPNRIGPADFLGWVQERGAYFPATWDEERYTAVLAMNDPGEAPLKGSLLIARHGQGWFVYTGLVFFRELPAGVPGAYRLFANLVSLGK